jgi:hypothetical protein
MRRTHSILLPVLSSSGSVLKVCFINQFHERAFGRGLRFCPKTAKIALAVLANCSRSKEPKTANRMSVVIQDMLSPPRNKFFL